MEDSGYSDLKTQSDAVIYFLQRLDIDMVNLLLLEDRTYQDLDKTVFIQKLAMALEQFHKAGDAFLDKCSGFCNSQACNFKCKGFTFIGNKSGRYMDLIIEIKGEEVQDIYECLTFKKSCRDMGESNRVYLDEFNGVF